jgi:hypothetical protein
MEMVQVFSLLQEYPLNSFVGTPPAISVNQDLLSSDMEKAFSGTAKEYLHSINDLVEHNADFLSNNVTKFRDYLSRLVGTTCSLKNLIQLGEDMTNVFEDDFNFAKGLAVRSMISILDRIIQEITILSNQTKSSRVISRIRSKVYFVIWQKIPQMFNILSTLMAIELKQISPNEIVLAIGKGMKLSQFC